LRNFESPRLKVNEADGNPIEIAAIIVWKVVDTAQATFNVDMLEKFVEKQTESALRALATKYPYDKHESHKLSLHENIDEVNEQLGHQVSQSLQSAGIEIIEARISHLAYAPEIAAAMLQRQQAQAIIAARQKIVDGAVGMVDMALKKLTQNGIVQLDEERKAAMVSNLLVVLCSERPSQPVLNTGTIY
jgi:regulator of protease activity HflC (stomatin/prohibitin superfamily)